MSSPSTIHLPTDAIPRGEAAPRKEEQPVVLLAFAKLVLLIGAAVFLAPLWLAMIGNAASSNPAHESWVALRLIIVGGTVTLFAMLVAALKVWAGLLKHLARAD